MVSNLSSIKMMLLIQKHRHMYTKTFNLLTADLSYFKGGLVKKIFRTILLSVEVLSLQHNQICAALLIHLIPKFWYKCQIKILD